MTKRKAVWITDGLVARVRHLRGEDKLRHATIQSVGPQDEQPDDLDVERHPDEE